MVPPQWAVPPAQEDVGAVLDRARKSIAELRSMGGQVDEAEGWLSRAEEAYRSGITSTTRIYAEYALGAAQGHLDEMRALRERIQETVQQGLDTTGGHAETRRLADEATTAMKEGRVDDAREGLHNLQHFLRTFDQRRSDGAPRSSTVAPGAAFATCPLCGNFVQAAWTACKYCGTVLRGASGRDSSHRLTGGPLREAAAAPTIPADADVAPVPIVPPTPSAPTVTTVVQESPALPGPTAPAAPTVMQPGVSTASRCPTCGEEVEPSWARCPACGNLVALPASTAPVDQPPVVVAEPARGALSGCPRCSEPIEEGWPRCPACGLVIADAGPSGAAGVPPPAAPPQAGEPTPRGTFIPPVEDSIVAAFAMAPQESGVIAVTPQPAPVVAIPVTFETIPDDPPLAVALGPDTQAHQVPATDPGLAGAGPRRCLNCGEEFPEGGRFCGGCGAPPPP